MTGEVGADLQTLELNTLKNVVAMQQWEVNLASAIENGIAVWMWPLTAARLGQDWFETMTSAHSVIDARMPTISEAWINPLTADYRELCRMVTEKTEAFRQSKKSIGSAQSSVRHASEANVCAFGRLSSGGWLGLSEWTEIFERNLEIGSTLAMLPTEALAPIHSKVTENVRRLVGK